MSYGISSDEVAEDYRKALEDLTMNSRYEINNLTVIAKENTEHALAISEALKNHIKRTAPVKKLPAFYVLDSVVKNVGTPYTLFFGRNLYATFMEAYVLVDNNIRRKMEEMLKTWKEPVPGSMDTRPVFPIEITRPIENALIKARTSALQANQEYARNQQQMLNRGRPGMAAVPYRDTPTPPNVLRQQQYPTGYSSNYAQQYPITQGVQPLAVPQPNSQPQYTVPQPQISRPYPITEPTAPSWEHQLLQSQGFRVPDNSIDTLNSDIADLITTSKAEFAQNPYDGSIQTRLKALLDLQSILRSQKLPPEQIAMIKDQVAHLSLSAKPPPVPLPVLASVPVPAPAPVTVSQPPTQPPSLTDLLGGSAALAALFARSSATPKVPTPPTPQPVQPVRSPLLQYTHPQHTSAPAPITAPAPVADPAALLEKLRAAGMLPPLPATASTPPALPSALASTLPPNLPQSLPFINQPQVPSNLKPHQNEIVNDVQLKPASLKIPRPYLISTLYEHLGAPCSQCGRRFKSDEDGKKKKTAHMDWHFRVHQRTVETEKRGQNRSLYLDELDWIKSRESEDSSLTSVTNGSIATTSEPSTDAKSSKLQYLPVPDDTALANSLCPICQERFEIKWLDDAQEFVWMDAVKIGDRIYHASCHVEAKKDGGSTPAYQRGTPEPILGKRKNDDDHLIMRTKLKAEPLSY